jgi:RNA polymerase sigma factor (sigma-70 family)
MTHLDTPHEVRPRLSVAETGKLDSDEFHAFYQSHYSNVMRFLVTQGAENADAEDAVAETFVALMRVRDWSNIRDPRAYLYRAALNTLYHFRSGRQELFRESLSYDPMFELRDRGVDPPTNVHAKEILRAIRLLPPRQQTVMALSVDGYSCAEIAELLGLNENAVRQNLHRGRRTLRTLLDDQGEVTTEMFG